MKYFYSIVVDGYAYHDVTEHRYKNEIDFYYHVLPENFDNLRDYYGVPNVWDYLYENDYYPTGDSYVAVDENNNVLEDIEDSQVTFAEICKSYVNMIEEPIDDEYELYKKLKEKYEVIS